MPRSFSLLLIGCHSSTPASKFSKGKVFLLILFTKPLVVLAMPMLIVTSHFAAFFLFPFLCENESLSFTFCDANSLRLDTEAALVLTVFTFWGSAASRAKFIILLHPTATKLAKHGVSCRCVTWPRTALSWPSENFKVFLAPYTTLYWLLVFCNFAANCDFVVNRDLFVS